MLAFRRTCPSRPSQVLRGFWIALALICVTAGAANAVDATYTYDALGRLTGVTYNCSASTTYVYDAAGNRTSSGAAAPTGCPPSAVNDAAATAAGTPVTFDPRVNDSDANGYALTITATSTPGHGGVAINSGTSLTYTPTAGYSGTDSFTYTISNGHSGTATATDTITVWAPPVAVGDSVTTNFNTPATFDPRTNDTDSNGFVLTITATSTPAHGSVAINSGSSLTYTPTSGYSGADSFTYTISDGHGGTAMATVSVTVNAAPVNHPPVAVNDTWGLIVDYSGTPVNPSGDFDPTGNDSDPDGDTLTITAVGAPGHPGAATAITSAHVVHYQYGTSVSHELSTTDSFTYTISDGHGHTATATITVDITVNDITH